ncbi:MAG: prolyl oligopeptidase family serine peptidase [Vicinamibacterales bacterium]
MRSPLALLILLILTPPATAAGQNLHPFSLDDYLALKAVSDIELSPDGRNAVWVVREVDKDKDTRHSALWARAMDGGTPRRLTRPETNARFPRYAPDGRHLGFIATGPDETAQVFVLPLDGGEAMAVTRLPGGVEAFAWSPDSTRLALIASDPDPTKTDDKDAPPPPIVVTRLQQKQDGAGYTTGDRSRLYVQPVAEAIRTSGRQVPAAVVLTDGPYDAAHPAWSPDGTLIAFDSNRSAPDPDRTNNSDIWIADVAQRSIRQLTTATSADSSPAWSPDGGTIAFVSMPEKPAVYATPRVLTIPATGGATTDWTGRFDRHVNGTPLWAPDGNAIYVSLVDSGRHPLVRVTRDGRRTTIVDGDLDDFAMAGGRIAVVMGTPTRPSEAYAVQLPSSDAPVAPAPLSEANDALFGTLHVTAAEEVHYPSADGTDIEGWVIKPPGFDATRKYPLVLRIHGGPVGQYTDSWDAEHQFLAAQGFVVLITNPRGSSGYGEDFCKAIYADWGHKDTQDVLAGVDHLVSLGYIDEARLGVGGWSYGGILTNYVITQSARFRAAISGASETDMFSAFGTDDLVRWWIDELGTPWENEALYRKLSPIYKVEGITTPTLLMVGQEDHRVPLPQSEQLYLQLRALDRAPTGLIVYPGQSHGFRRPSYEVDRLRRYAYWYAKYLTGEGVDPLYRGFEGGSKK